MIRIDGDFQLVMGYPNSWLVFVTENPTEMDDDWGYPYLWIYGNHHIRMRGGSGTCLSLIVVVRSHVNSIH